MMDRLQDAFEVQERFASNASHELRTPLTVMSTLLDVARRDPAGTQYPELVQRLTATSNRAIGLTEALLRLADANAVSAAFLPVNLATVVTKVMDESSEELAEAGIVPSHELDGVQVSGDETLLEQLVGNLLQNAIRHNDARGIIRISVHRDGENDSVELSIENTGAVYTTHMTERLVEPFMRQGGRVRPAPGSIRGYGLGLALVHRIARVHHSRLRLAPLDDGGLCVTVSFPPA
jgi:two-component system sensor histidine kinase VanS